MLCHEGISLMLNVFRGKTSMPNFHVVAPPNGEAHEIHVHESVPNPGFSVYYVVLPTNGAVRLPKFVHMSPPLS